MGPTASTTRLLRRVFSCLVSSSYPGPRPFWRRRSSFLLHSLSKRLIFVGRRRRREAKETATLLTSIPSGARQVPSRPAAGPHGPLAGSILRNVLSSLDEAKAEDVVSIDLRGKTALADEMIVATGRSTVHVGAIADKVVKACKAAGVAAPRVEGLPHCDWVLVDAGDVIVHVFRPEVRQFYNLEKMWGGDRPRELRLA